MIGEVDTGTALTLIERASRALSKAESEAKLKDLAQQSKSIIAVTDPASRVICHESLMVLKTIRIRIQSTGKEAREDATAYSKAVIAEEKRLIAIIEPEESRLAAIRDEWDAQKEREKERKIQEEIARVTAIQRRIEEIRNWPVHCANQTSLVVGQVLQKATSYLVDAALFEEFTEHATAALWASRAVLTSLLTERKANEAEQERIKTERAELAKLKAEAAERERVAAEERAKIEAADQAKRDAEAKAQAEANRLERERIANEEAAAKAVRDAETQRLADERKANEAETARIGAARADLERQQEAARLAAQPKPRKRGKAPPTQEAILEVVAKAFPNDDAAGLLAMYDWRKTVAA